MTLPVSKTWEFSRFHTGSVPKKRPQCSRGHTGVISRNLRARSAEVRSARSEANQFQAREPCGSSLSGLPGASLQDTSIIGPGHDCTAIVAPVIFHVGVIAHFSKQFEEFEHYRSPSAQRSAASMADSNTNSSPSSAYASVRYSSSSSGTGAGHRQALPVIQYQSR